MKEEQKDKEVLIIGGSMTNDAVRGYVILAMKELGFKKEDIEKVVDELHYTFDTVSEQQAEQVYLDPFKYDKIKN